MRSLSDLEKKTLINIGNNAKYVRRVLLGVTLEDMAKITDVSRDVLCRLEAMSSAIDPNRSYPSITTVIKFCDHIGVTPAELFESDFSEVSFIRGKILEHCSDYIGESSFVVKSK